MDASMTSFRTPSIEGEEPSEGDDRDLRPQRMSEMVGQRATFERLSIAVDASRKRREEKPPWAQWLAGAVLKGWLGSWNKPKLGRVPRAQPLPQNRCPEPR